VENALAHRERLHHFTLRAAAEPSVLPRILENFALRNLVPQKLESRQAGGDLVVSLSVCGLDETESRHLQLRMLNIVPVYSVDLDHS